MFAENDHGDNSDAKTGIAFFTRRDELDDPNERLRIDNAGNVGIGTASPTDTGGYGRALDIQSNTGAAIYLRTNDDTSQIAQGSSDLTIRTRQAHPIIFNTNNSERLRIDSSGNVGIGTTSPSTNFHLNESSTNTATFRISNDDGYHEFKANNGNLTIADGTSDRLRIDSSGRLLVGTR